MRARAGVDGKEFDSYCFLFNDSVCSVFVVFMCYMFFDVLP